MMRDFGIAMLIVILLAILFRAYVEGAFYLAEAIRAYATRS